MMPDKIVKDASGGETYIRPRALSDYTRAIARAKEVRAKRDQGDGEFRGNFSSVDGGERFTATESIDQYEDMLLHGWQHGVTDVEGLDGLSTDAAEKLQFVRNVGGAFPVVPAYLAGMPNAMLQATHHDAETVRGLTLVIDACFHCGVDSETVLEYARTVMRMVAWLQAEQIDVSVYCIIPIRLGTKRVVYTTPIREAGQVMQPERIAAILHPSWLRRAWFALLEHEYFDFGVGKARQYPEASACKGGYGGVTHATAEEMQQALPEAYSVIMLPKVGTSNPEAAIQEAITLKLKRT